MLTLYRVLTPVACFTLVLIGWGIIRLVQANGFILK